MSQGNDGTPLGAATGYVPGRRVLHLRVRECYFVQIRDGIKPLEYRLRSPYWEKRILNPDGTWREYDEVCVHNAYKPACPTNQVRSPWRAPHTDEISHEHFGPEEQGVFCIPVGAHNRGFSNAVGDQPHKPESRSDG